MVICVVGNRYRVVVDGDACPVKAEIAQAVRSCGATALMVSSYKHELLPGDRIQVATVDAGSQSTDMYIANLLTANDILVTGDYGLAALGLSRGAAVLTPRGDRIRETDIDLLLAQRHQSAKLRRSGARTKGPHAFSDADRSRFLQNLTSLLQRMQENCIL